MNYEILVHTNISQYSTHDFEAEVGESCANKSHPETFHGF